MRNRHLSRDEALASISKKKEIELNQAFMDQLTLWEQVEYELWEDPERKIPKPMYKDMLHKMHESRNNLKKLAWNAEDMDVSGDTSQLDAS